MEWYGYVILTITGLLVLLPVIMCWTLAIGSGMYWARDSRRQPSRAQGELQVCTTDAECPKRHVCVGGRCIIAAEG